MLQHQKLFDDHLFQMTIPQAVREFKNGIPIYCYDDNNNTEFLIEDIKRLCTEIANEDFIFCIEKTCYKNTKLNKEQGFYINALINDEHEALDNQLQDDPNSKQDVDNKRNTLNVIQFQLKDILL